MGELRKGGFNYRRVDSKESSPVILSPVYQRTKVPLEENNKTDWLHAVH